jgi:hypothetical protein
MKINYFRKKSALLSRSLRWLAVLCMCGCAQQSFAAGADSQRSDLTVYGKDSISICENALPLRYGDTTFFPGTKSGVYAIRFVTGPNSDSIVRLTLRVQPSYRVYDTLKLCQSDLPFLYGSTVISTTTPVGTHSRVLYLKTKAGCDSVIFLQLTVSASYNNEVRMSVCENEFPIRFGGREITAAGIYAIPLQSKDGCDSTIRLQVQTNPTYRRYDTVRICPSQLPYLYSGKWYTDGGNYVVENISRLGCDSITLLALQVYRYPVVNDTLHLCQSAFPYRYGSTLIMEKGDYDVKLRSKEGCDSIVKLAVVAEQSYRVPHYLHLCTNDLPYEYGDRKIVDTGYYVIALRSIYNCDSVVDLHVTIGRPSFTAFVDTICWGETYNKRGYKIPFSPFNEYYIINGRKPAANMEGCDSNFTITVRIMPVYENNDSLLVCDGDLPLTRHGRVFAAAGNHKVQLKTIHGCDSIINFCLQTTKTYHFTRTEHFCAGTVYKVGDSSFNKAGRYHVAMRTKGGCDSIIDLTLIMDDRAPYTPGQIYTKKDLYETDKHTFWISSVPNASFYRWNYTNKNWLPIGSTNDYVFALRNLQDGDTGTVSVVAGNACGLSGVSRVQVLVQVTALSEAERDHNIRVYPNPANEKTVLDLDGMAADAIELRDMSGRLLLVLPVTDSRVEIPLQSYSAGYYIIRVTEGRSVLKTLPLIKQ